MTARVRALAWVVALGTVAAACAGRRNLVEAPMTSADASAAAIALGRAPGEGSRGAEKKVRDLPFKVGDRWTGSYNCRQGRTELAFVLDRLDEHGDETAVEAVFEFHFTPPNGSAYAAASGSARMRGTFEQATRRLRLDGDEWIDRPASYELINLVGTLDKTGGYAGTVEGPGCSRFSATRDGP